MKCSKCGNEFGNGANCQSCGVDRVTGLGNYRGYNIPIDDVEHASYPEQEGRSIITQHQKAIIGSIVCYACGEVIPDNSKFCPYCSKELYVKCPKCGQTYSSQYPACNQCGTNRNEYYERIRKEKIELEIERIKREQGESAAIKRRAQEIELNQKLRARTPEGRAELEKERSYLEECRKKWRNM